MAEIAIQRSKNPRIQELLTPEAVRFVAELHGLFEPARRTLMELRATRQRFFNEGGLPDFLPETKDVRDGSWVVAPIPADLQNRRVEITGPVDRKMMINALNCGANCFMADFEDSLAPTWENVIDGQLNVKDRWGGTLEIKDGTGKHYKLNKDLATLILRPRGWHLMERHFRVDGQPVAGALVDFGLSFFHNAKAQIAQGTGPYYYLPKTENHIEARLWNEVFIHAQKVLELPIGTIKATVLIETLPAAFEMDEILYELKDHIAGLNCGRWDYIFSFIKTLSGHKDFILPDRAQVVMGKDFLRAYSLLLIQTCHKRGAFAMGGMSAFIPVKNDEAANAKAFTNVKADKTREATDGHDGTWVAHPDLVPVAKAVFDELMPTPNQVHKLKRELVTKQADLLKVHDGTRTEHGLRENIRVGVQYIEAWLRGRGAVPLYNLMEDAATAEICRTQIWQWLRYGAQLEDGRVIDKQLVDALIADEMNILHTTLGDTFTKGRFKDALGLFNALIYAPQCEAFLTSRAYGMI